MDGFMIILLIGENTPCTTSFIGEMLMVVKNQSLTIGVIRQVVAINMAASQDMAIRVSSQVVMANSRRTSGLDNPNNSSPSQKAPNWRRARGI